MRVVSLVPSATETLLALGVTPIACTRFCEQPALATVGGTKDPDVARIIELSPDLVVVNDEENRREDADVLVAAGLALHSMSPRTVETVADAVAALGAAVGVPIPAARLPPSSGPAGRVLTFIWRRPWMTMRADTYGASLLARLGWTDVVGATADRYPALDLDAAAALDPDLVVLPSEPYPFGRRHVPEVARAFPRSRVVPVDGRDLFWWGIRTPAAAARLAVALADDGTAPH